MTPEAQRIAIAEVMGWTWKPELFGLIQGPGHPSGARNVPDYPADLNAMHEAEKGCCSASGRNIIATCKTSSVAHCFQMSAWRCTRASGPPPPNAPKPSCAPSASGKKPHPRKNNMSVTTRYSIECNSCNRQQYSEGEDEITDALLGAHRAGWRRHVVPNGATWDFCPRCARFYEEELSKSTTPPNPLAQVAELR